MKNGAMDIISRRVLASSVIILMSSFLLTTLFILIPGTIGPSKGGTMLVGVWGTGGVWLGKYEYGLMILTLRMSGIAFILGIILMAVNAKLEANK